MLSLSHANFKQAFLSLPNGKTSIVLKKLITFSTMSDVNCKSASYPINFARTHFHALCMRFFMSDASVISNAVASEPMMLFLLYRTQCCDVCC